MSKYTIEQVVSKWHELDKAERELADKLTRCRAAKKQVHNMIIAMLPEERKKQGVVQAKYVVYLEDNFIHNYKG